jgi:hypothetical protein
VSDGLVELDLGCADQGCSSIIEQIPFGIILLVIKDNGALKPLEEPGSSAGPVTYIEYLTVEQRHGVAGLTSEYSFHRPHE